MKTLTTACIKRVSKGTNEWMNEPKKSERIYNFFAYLPISYCIHPTSLNQSISPNAPFAAARDELSSVWCDGKRCHACKKKKKRVGDFGYWQKPTKSAKIKRGLIVVKLKVLSEWTKNKKQNKKEQTKWNMTDHNSNNNDKSKQTKRQQQEQLQLQKQWQQQQ